MILMIFMLFAVEELSGSEKIQLCKEVDERIMIVMVVTMVMRIQILSWLNSQHYGNSDFEIVNISSHQTEDLLNDSSECHTTNPQKIIFDVFSFCCYIQGGPKKKEQV